MGKVLPDPNRRTIKPIRDGIPPDTMVFSASYSSSAPEANSRSDNPCVCEEPKPDDKRTIYVAGENGTIRYNPCRRCGRRIKA